VLEGWPLFPDQSFQCRDSVAEFNLNVEDTIDVIALDPAPQLDRIRHIDDPGPLLLQDQQRGWSSGVQVGEQTRRVISVGVQIELRGNAQHSTSRSTSLSRTQPFYGASAALLNLSVAATEVR
jgi:hypothetical protein